MTEYDYATDIAVQKEEAYEDGLFAGLERGLATGREEGISIGLERGLATGREEGISIGLEQGAYQNKLETARNFLLEGVAHQMVARCTDLPLETVLELEQNL